MQCPDQQWPGSRHQGVTTTYHHQNSVVSQQRTTGWTRKDMEEEEKRERRRRQRQKVVSCCKSLAAYLFSHIGLAAMVVAYSIMGGFLFQALEAPYEFREKLRIQGWKEERVEDIWQLSVSLRMDKLDKVTFTEKVRTIFTDFQVEVTQAVKEKGWDGKDATGETDLQWSFAGALLYAVTVITTIGYGHVAPKTTAGRLVTILYALVGIPLTFLYLSNIGNFLADCFRLFYKKICCDICCCQKCERIKKRERRRMRRRKGVANQSNTVLPNIRYESEPDLSRYRHDDGGGEEDEVGYRHTSVSGLPGGDQAHGVGSVAASDEVCSNGGCPMPRSKSLPLSPDYEKPWDLGGLDDDNLQETAIMGGSDSDTAAADEEDDVQLTMDDDDDVRETDILDDDTDDENTKFHHQNHVAHVIQNQMHANTVDSDGEHYEVRRKHNSSSKKGKGKSVRDSLAVSENVDPHDRSPSAHSDRSGLHRDKDTMKRHKSRKKDRDQSGDKSLPRRSKSRDASKDKKRDNTIKRDKEKKDKDKKDKDKKDTKRDKDSSQSRSKDKQKEKDKQTSKDKQKTKDKDKDKQKDKVKYKTLTEKERKELQKSEKEELKKEKARQKSEKGRKDKSSIETEPSSQSDLIRKELKRKDSKRLSRKETKRKRNESKKNKVRIGSVSSVDEDELDGSYSRAYRGSEESFVTAPSERSFADEGIYNEVFEDDGTVTKQPLNSSAHYSDVAIDMMDSPYDIEMIEYPNLKNTPVNFNLDEPFDEEEDVGKVTVPISICLVIIAGYIFAGSVLFTLWEEWDYLTGSYFCFITLSTIGFGDIVPGTDMKEWASHEKLVLCALWLAFGLSLLAMCFNLMQEEVKEKCKWLGQKLGLLKDDDEG